MVPAKTGVGVRLNPGKSCARAFFLERASCSLIHAIRWARNRPKTSKNKPETTQKRNENKAETKRKQAENKAETRVKQS
jgi:hypothetical protein